MTVAHLDRPVASLSAAPLAETVRWNARQLPPSDALPLATVLELLTTADAHCAVARMLDLLSEAIGAGPAIAIEYVLQGGGLKVRQVVTAAADRRSSVGSAGCLPPTMSDPAHSHLVALAGGAADEPVIGLRCPLPPATAWPAVLPGKPAGGERVSVLYGLGERCAWAMHFNAAAHAPFGPDTLSRLPARALLVREIHRIVSPAEPVVCDRVDSAEIRLGLRAASLSGRERQICARIAGGHSAASIASELGISTSTVVTLRKRAYAKLGIHDRLDLRHLAG